MASDIIKTFPFVLAAAFFLDMIVGDPTWLPHPVRFMGRLISFFDEKFNNKGYNNKSNILKGAVTVLAVGFITVIISTLLLFVLFKISFWTGFLGEIIMSTYCLAGKDLIRHAMNVYNSRYDIDQARASVGKIVGRDISNLSEQGVIKAAIESVAESLNDGVIAPAFYMILLGPIGGLLYKAVNTMDSMIGYHNEKYEYYGKPAARTDDILNFIPSRLSALFLIVASFILRMDCKGAFRVFRRDRNKHKSPNSAQTESAMAGALGLRLGGPSTYSGVLVDKPYIGEEDSHEASYEDIKGACRLMYSAALLGVISFLCVFWIVLLDVTGSASAIFPF
ncbi:MAG: adenosylcobinamide-phosphate synthase CbiB [Lachnospiraceae bacterium]|nr:adenosylcobinamide-phosphate synthase CbiB [Lachnospiraceae bacterium]